MEDMFIDPHFMSETKGSPKPSISILKTEMATKRQQMDSIYSVHVLNKGMLHFPGEMKPKDMQFIHGT